MSKLAWTVTQYIRTGEGKDMILVEAKKLHPRLASLKIYGAQGAISLALRDVPMDANGQAIPELQRVAPQGWGPRLEEMVKLAGQVSAPLRDKAGSVWPCGDREPAKLRLPLMRNHGYDGLPGDARVRKVGYVDFLYDPAYKDEVEKASADPFLTANALGVELGFKEPKQSFKARGGGESALIGHKDWSMGGDPWNRMAGISLGIPEAIKKAVYDITDFIPA